MESFWAIFELNWLGFLLLVGKSLSFVCDFAISHSHISQTITRAQSGFIVMAFA